MNVCVINPHNFCLNSLIGLAYRLEEPTVNILQTERYRFKYLFSNCKFTRAVYNSLSLSSTYTISGTVSILIIVDFSLNLLSVFL